MHTLESLQKASDEELRVLCAELCGWTVMEDAWGFWRAVRPDGRLDHSIPGGFVRAKGFPNFPASLDAVAEAEKIAIAKVGRHYTDTLACSFHDGFESGAITASARERCISVILSLQQP